MNTRINSYAKVKDEIKELNNKIKEIKELILYSNKDSKDIILDITKILL